MFVTELVIMVVVKCLLLCFYFFFYSFTCFYLAAWFPSQIISHNTGRQSRNTLNEPAQKTKKPETLFTEEEFQEFQKEYFGSLTE